MEINDYLNLKVGDKVHHKLKDIDMYLACWVHMKMTNKCIAGFTKSPVDPSVKDYLDVEDTILVSPEFIEINP